jgi:hypothetical protein
MDASDAHPSPVIYPVFDESRGHPPLVPGQMKSAILAHEGGGGLRVLLERFDSRALEIPVADEGVLLDLDTPADFKRLSARLATGAILSDRECRVLMEKVCRLPEAVIGHCRQVARVAAALAIAVNDCGGGLDVALVRSAAAVHDVARLDRNHAHAGADLLRAMGFPAMAAVIAVHMHIDVSANAPLDEAQLVYLADKWVKGNTVVNLNRRFDAKLGKYGHDPAVAVNINRQRQTALRIQGNLERLTGERVDRILQRAGIAGGSRSCKTS